MPLEDKVAWVEEAASKDHVASILEQIIDNGTEESKVISMGDLLMNTVHVPLKESREDDYALGVVSVGRRIHDAWVKDLLAGEIKNLAVVFYLNDRPVASNVLETRRGKILKASATPASKEGLRLIDGERFIMLNGIFENAGQPAGYVFGASLDKAMEPFVDLQWKLFIAGLATLGVGLVVVLFLTNRIVFPIRLLVTGTREIMRGNYDYKVENRSSDEVGTLADAFNHMTDGLREKEQIRELFGKYVHPSIVSDIMDNPENLHRGGTRKVQTLMFSDIAGFASISETMDAEKLIKLLNEYLGAMADEIAASEGIVDKYLGDGIMAFWGEPFTTGNHALLACRAALAMQRQLAGLREQWIARGLPPIEMRVGLATGDVIVGNIGSEQSQDYTCIGDPVNLASRLEGASKFYGTRIIIDEPTLTTAADGVIVRELDKVRVKGREAETRIFELIGIAGEYPNTNAGMYKAYEDSLGLYRKGDFAAALAVFDSLAETGGDPPQQGHGRTMPAAHGKPAPGLERNQGPDQQVAAAL